MTESKQAPTPGPWTIEEYGDDETPNLVIHKDSESRICFMATPGSHGDPAIIEANAHLITAAPDFLKALTGDQPDSPQLYAVEWLATLLEVCHKPKVMDALVAESDDDADAVSTALMEAASIVTKGRAAIVKAHYELKE